MHWRQYRYKQAEQCLHRALAISEKHNRKDMENLRIRLLNNIAVILREQGEYAEVEHYYRQGLELIQQKYGGDHLEVATYKTNLGMQRLFKGDLEGAETLFLEALATREKHLKINHESVATSYSILGKLYQVRGDYQRANTHLEEAGKRFQNALGKKSRGYMILLQRQSHVAVALGDLKDARTLIEEGMAAGTNKYGKDHIRLLGFLMDEADLLLLEGRYGEAQKIIDRALPPACRRKNLSISVIWNLQARIYWTQGRLAEAETLLREALALRRAKGNIRMGVTNLILLADFPAQKGEAAEARTLLEEWATLVEGQIAPDHEAYQAAASIEGLLEGNRAKTVNAHQIWPPKSDPPTGAPKKRKPAWPCSQINASALKKRQQIGPNSFLDFIG